MPKTIVIDKQTTWRNIQTISFQMTDRQTDRQTDKVKTNRLTTQSIISGMNIGLKHLSRYPVKECLTLPLTCSSHPVALCSSQCMSPRYIFIGHMTFYESPLSVTEFTRSRYATLFGFTTTNTMFYNITDAFLFCHPVHAQRSCPMSCCVWTLFYMAFPWPSLIISANVHFYVTIVTKQTLRLFPRIPEYVFFNHHFQCGQHLPIEWLFFKMTSIIIKVNTLTCNDRENMKLLEKINTRVSTSWFFHKF